MSKPPFSRVVSLEVRCTECRIPVFQPIDTDKVYSIIMPSYMANGGSAFGLVDEFKISRVDGGEAYL